VFISLSIALASAQLCEAKQDDQRDAGRTRPSESKPNRINVTFSPQQRNAQVYGYYISQKWLDETARSSLPKLHPDLSEIKARTKARAGQSIFQLHEFAISGAFGHLHLPTIPACHSK
jgi:hypothetical protein